MRSARTPLVLVVVVGPQASGKSTLATALSRRLRRDGDAVALVQLDQIAAMALPTLPGWDVAHGIFESVVGRWSRADLACVIAEGSGSWEEVVRLRAQAPEAAAVITIAVTAPFAVALARARRDPSRGLSRDAGFLGAVYDRWPAELARIAADVVIDTETSSVEQGVDVVLAAIDAARAASSSPR